MKGVVALAAILVAAPLAAQQPVAVAPTGTLVMMSATSEIELENDEAVADFYYEAQDADLTRAQSLVNQRLSEGTAALKRADPKAKLESSGYSSYPVYAKNNDRVIIGWRVRQGVTLRTENLAALPKTVAATQPSLALGRIDFGLTKATREKVEAQLIQIAMTNLQTRFAAAAQSMNVPANRLRIEEVDFSGRQAAPPRPMVMRSMAGAEQTTPVAFESGRSTERLTVNGKARLLP